MLNSNWCKQDSDFVSKQHLQYKSIVNFDFTMYKKVATYLFERQFYAKKKFVLSGQSLYLLIDGNRFKPFADFAFTTIIKGDGIYKSIAAASILAKTHRDEYMKNLANQYLKRNKNNCNHGLFGMT